VTDELGEERRKHADLPIVTSGCTGRYEWVRGWVGG
jgi:hypothetical protein